MTNSPFRKYFLFLGIFFGTFSVDGFSQTLPEKENDTIIVWTKDRKLNWDDFQNPAKFVDSTKTAAESEIAIDLISIPINKYDYKYVVFPYFYKRFSSTKTDDPNILKHEQVHFDIAELFARKMRKKLKQLNKKPFDEKLYNSEIDAIYEGYSNYQIKYDKETLHSLITEKQLEWENKIARELQALISFSSEIFK